MTAAGRVLSRGFLVARRSCRDKGFYFLFVVVVVGGDERKAIMGKCVLSSDIYELRYIFRVIKVRGE